MYLFNSFSNEMKHSIYMLIEVVEYKIFANGDYRLVVHYEYNAQEDKLTICFGMLSSSS